MSRSRQTEFVYWGGKREGAGRKAVPRPGHRIHRRVRRRAKVTARDVVHVVLPVSREIGRLRRRSAYQAIRRAMKTVLTRTGFRIVHASIQQNHLHLLVEAADEKVLARGVQGFEIAAARRLNAAVARDRRQPRARRGNVFINRYHVEIIRTPRQTRHALSYVLNNWRRHREDLVRPSRLDPYSSAVGFDGWRELRAPIAIPDGYEPLPVAGAETWLLTTGWRRYGPISVAETPGPRT